MTGPLVQLGGGPTRRRRDVPETRTDAGRFRPARRVPAHLRDRQVQPPVRLLHAGGGAALAAARQLLSFEEIARIVAGDGASRAAQASGSPAASRSCGAICRCWCGSSVRFPASRTSRSPPMACCSAEHAEALRDAGVTGSTSPSIRSFPRASTRSLAARLRGAHLRGARGRRAPRLRAAQDQLRRDARAQRRRDRRASPRPPASAPGTCASSR
jgi:hypothetical protein